MIRSLRFRLFLAHVLALLAALLVLVLLAGHLQRRWLLERNVETLERAARLVARDLSLEPAARAGRYDAAADSLGRALDSRVTLIDASGRVVGDSEVPLEELAGVESHAGRPEVRAALARRSGHAVRRSATVGIDFVYVAIPAAIGDVAVVRVAEPLDTLLRLNRSLLGISIAVASLTLLLGAGIVFWITGRHAARIRALERVAQRLGAGEPVRAREQPADELGQLGGALNRMAAELRLRVAALEGERDIREQILAHLSDGVALLDGAGRVLHMNHGLALLLGGARPAAPGSRFQEFARVPELHDLVRRARAARASLEAELRLWVPRPRLVRAVATPLGSAAEGGLLLVVHDLSEAEMLNRVRQDFVANVSHELRTPLTSLRGYAETLIAGGLDDVENRGRFVEIIRDQTVRLQALVEDLLSLAELERPDLRLRTEPFDLREAVAGQVAACRSRAEALGLSLEFEDGAPVPLAADRARIEQVAANLLDNALKYTDRGHVRVRVGSGEGLAWCEVEDSGTGIPVEDQPRIFERFYRVDKARSREKGGTGLGLSIVKHIVALHGGRITLASEPGRGSRFRFEVPVAPAGGGIGARPA